MYSVNGDFIPGNSCYLLVTGGFISKFITFFYCCPAYTVPLERTGVVPRRAIRVEIEKGFVYQRMIYQVDVIK
jgi:hypothetical protein